MPSRSGALAREDVVQIHLGVVELDRRARGGFVIRRTGVLHVVRGHIVAGRQVHQFHLDALVILVSAGAEFFVRQRHLQERRKPELVLPFAGADRVVQQNQLAARLRVVDERLLRRFSDAPVDVNDQGRITGQAGRNRRLLERACTWPRRRPRASSPAPAWPGIRRRQSGPRWPPPARRRQATAMPGAS